ncbi:unnamed protein product [Owenia fusiformis]|uniref:Uncharacterized protein n=1 Tax=Owenia fusiformis TaxID=6347 RepID=A0A8S4PT60_OWEFU|nr:unnamed protein product [Owenia fusiformis]
MDPRHRQILQTNLPYLLANIKLTSTFYAEARNLELLSYDMIDAIETSRDPSARATALLDMLQRPNTFYALLKALERSGQKHLVRRLKNDDDDFMKDKAIQVPENPPSNVVKTLKKHKLLRKYHERDIFELARSLDPVINAAKATLSATIADLEDEIRELKRVIPAEKADDTTAKMSLRRRIYGKIGDNYKNDTWMLAATNIQIDMLNKRLGDEIINDNDPTYKEIEKTIDLYMYQELDHHSKRLESLTLNINYLLNKMEQSNQTKMVIQTNNKVLAQEQSKIGKLLESYTGENFIKSKDLGEILQKVIHDAEKYKQENKTLRRRTIDAEYETRVNREAYSSLSATLQKVQQNYDTLRQEMLSLSKPPPEDRSGRVSPNSRMRMARSPFPAIPEDNDVQSDTNEDNDNERTNSPERLNTPLSAKSEPIYSPLQKQEYRRKPKERMCHTSPYNTPRNTPSPVENPHRHTLFLPPI